MASLQDFIDAIRAQESGGDPNAVSPQGARGSMQITEGTFNQFKQGKERFNNEADRNAAATRYITYLGDQTDWDAHKMAEGYIAGVGGIGKNRRDALGTSTQSYANQIVSRLANKAEAAPVSQNDISFDDLVPQKQDAISGNDVSFDDLIPKQAQAQPSLGQQLYANSEAGTAVLGGLLGAALGTPTDVVSGPLGTIAGSGLGTAGALAARRAIGVMLGYEKPATATEMAGQTVRGVAQGATAEMGGQVIARVLQPITRAITNPGDAVRSLLGGNQTTQAAQQAVRDSIATGIPLTAAENSGSDFALGAESVLGSLPGSKGVYVPFREQQLNKASQALDDAVNNIGPPGQAAANVGDKVGNAFGKLVKDMTDARTQQGASNFAFLDTSLGNTRYIPLTNFRQQLQKEMDRIPTVGADAEQRSRFIQLQNIASSIDQSSGRASGIDMNGLLSSYSSKMHGNGSMFSAVAPDSADRALAGRLYESLDNDLGAASQMPQIPKAVADGLNKARQDWRLHSDAITAMKDSVIGKTLGTPTAPSGDAIYAKIASMKPGDIKDTTKILDRADPSVMQDVRARYLEDMINKSSTIVTGPGQQWPTRTVNPASWISNAAKNREKLEALLPNGQANQVMAITRQLARIQQTKEPSQMISYIGNAAGGAGLVFMGKNLLYGNTAAAAGYGAAMGTAYISNRSIARALTNQQGIRAMQTLLNPQASRGAAVNAWNALINYGTTSDE